MQQLRLTTLFSVLVLLLLPVSGFALTESVSFFTPPSTDISVQIIQSIFGSGSDDLNGKLLRPLTLVLCSGIVMFMGAVFAWNTTKFVLHTAQQGEMMVGKGKELGLVILRSVFGLAMVMPIYSGGTKGLCMAFVFVGWLISQGIGLADRGVNAVVDYLSAGGTIYQVATSSVDTLDKQAMADPVTNMLAAQSCMYRLRKANTEKNSQNQETSNQLKAVGSEPTPAGTPYAEANVGYYFDADKGRIDFGTRNTASTATNGKSPYFNECGSMSWDFVANTDVNAKAIQNLAMAQMMVDLDMLARQIGYGSSSTQTAAIDSQTAVTATTAINNYTNMMGPLRTKMAKNAQDDMTNTWQSIKLNGWIVLGAYYPMMGKLEKQNKKNLSAFKPNAGGGDLFKGNANSPTGSAFPVGELTDADKTALKNQSSAVLKQVESVKNLVFAVDTANPATLQEMLHNASVTSNLGSNWLATAAMGGLDSATDYLKGDTLSVPGDKYKGLIAGYGGVAVNEIGNWFENNQLNSYWLGGSNSKSGETLGGTLNNANLKKSAALVGLASAVGGPQALLTIPPFLAIFVSTIGEFRNAIDQTQNPDPLLALQKFGFSMLDKAVYLMMIAFGAALISAIPLSLVPSLNFTGIIGATASMQAPFVSMFFMAFAAAGIGFGIYIPSIPFIVWVAAVLGWLGHTFQAIIGAPLVALRFTTAEGEGLLGGATEGVMMLMGVLFTPFLLVVGLCASLIVIKQMMVLLNYLFSIFAYYSFSPYVSSWAWVIIGVPGILFLYFTLMLTVVQTVCTKLIGELPGEALRHLHTAMIGHKSADQMLNRAEQSSDKLGSQAGEGGSRLSTYQSPSSSSSGGKKGGENKGENKGDAK